MATRCSLERKAELPKGLRPSLRKCDQWWLIYEARKSKLMAASKLKDSLSETVSHKFDFVTPRIFNRFRVAKNDELEHKYKAMTCVHQLFTFGK